MPRYLTAASITLALWVAAASGEVVTGILPALVVLVLAGADYVLWERHEEARGTTGRSSCCSCRPSSPLSGSRWAGS